MTDRHAGAYAISALMHLGIVALALVLTYAVTQEKADAPKILELVAGGGNNYAATAAPALGDPAASLKLDAPAPVAPQPDPTPAPPVPETPPAPLQAEPTPVAAPPTPAPAKPAPTAAKPPDFSKTVARTAARRESRIMTKYRKQLEADEKRQRMTEEQFRKAHPNAGRAAPSKVARVDAAGIREGVVGGSAANKEGGAGGRALTREEGDEAEAYFALLRNHLQDSFEELKPTDVSDQLSAKVGFFVGADGAISRVRLLRSSGNAEFDRAVLEAFRRTSPIGPRPDHRGDEVSLDFSMHTDDASR